MSSTIAEALSKQLRSFYSSDPWGPHFNSDAEISILKMSQPQESHNRESTSLEANEALCPSLLGKATIA